MPVVYDIALATEANVTTNATPATENNTFALKAGAAANFALQSVYVIGKGAGLTAISGIAFRIVSWQTAGTAGTTITPTPKDTRVAAAKTTGSSAATIGTGTRLNHVLFGCGAAGPGGWVAPNPDSGIIGQGGTITSTELINASGTASLVFEWSGEIVE